MFIVFLYNVIHCNDSAPCWDLDWTIKSYLIPVEIDLSIVPAHFFHLSRRTTVIQDLLVRRQFSLVPDKRQCRGLDGSRPKMCPAVRPFDQDGPHSRT